MANTATVRRNVPGTSAKDFNDWPSVDINEMEGTLSLQQYLQQTLRKKCWDDIDALIALPEGQDEVVWKYENLRQFTLELGLLIVKLDGACTSSICPEMKCTDEWEFLCAAHDPPRPCCAIDYFIHTLKQTSDTLNDPKLFHSRVSIPKNSAKHFPSLARRLYRLLAHCYFHHNAIFVNQEEEVHLCERFTKFITMYRLVPKKQQIISQKW